MKIPISQCNHSVIIFFLILGKIENGEEYKATILEVKDIDDIFETMVDKVSVEIIDENKDSIIEMEIELK